MKHYALELLGYFAALLPKPRSSAKPIQAKALGPSPCPVDRSETSSDHGPHPGHLVQIGVVALDYQPNLPGALAPIRSDGRRPLGPVRIIASVG